MVNRIISSGKKKIIAWMLAIALVTCGAGSAVGIILAGSVDGEIQVAASQAIFIDAANFGINDLSSHAQRRFVSVSDDATAFSAAFLRQRMSRQKVSKWLTSSYVSGTWENTF